LTPQLPVGMFDLAMTTAEAIQCALCPKACIIEPGQSGECRIRVNLAGTLRAVTYGFPCSVHLDPIEKKPLFHFLPGTQILSLATVGCNLHCKFCQNWEISQRNPETVAASPCTPEQVPGIAKREGVASVAYTYTEPLAYYEYTLDCCTACRKAGLKNVLVTAGYINKEPLKALCEVADAANIDLKAYSDTFYRDICGGSLKPVLDTLVLTKSMGLVVEVTNLVVPTLNDSDDGLTKLSRWVKENMGAETPLHFSAFTPRYQMRHLPPTPPETLLRARELARAEGLKHVYIGNVLAKDGGNTVCSTCGMRLIERQRYVVVRNRLDTEGRCPICRSEVYGLWK